MFSRSTLIRLTPFAFTIAPGRPGLFLIGILAVASWTSTLVHGNERESGESLYTEGQSRLAEIHDTIRSRELAEHRWAEEKLYLESLIVSLKNRHEELDGQLAELGQLVDRREAEWKQLEDQAARAEGIATTLAPVVNDWLHRVRALLPQAPGYLRTELGNELEILEHYPETEFCRQVAHRLEVLIKVLEKLNLSQTQATPVVETWEDALPGNDVVRVIYLGLGTALYQVAATGETGWYRYVEGDWERLEVSGAKDVFLNYWNALESSSKIGIFTFPYPPEG